MLNCTTKGRRLGHRQAREVSTRNLLRAVSHLLITHLDASLI